ncbi:MAG: hypothetical protein ACK5M4_04250 [Pseudorhodobacter sp.]
MLRGIAGLAPLLIAACLPFGQDMTTPSPITGPEVEATILTETLAADADTGATSTTEPAPPAVKSASQIVCEKAGGQMVRAGGSPLSTCQKPMRDAGKACSRRADCKGECLARSGTCAPVAPLFGCNEVLQQDGRRVTLCID